MEIHILHTNDMHSYLDDFARIAYIIQQQRQPHTLLLDAGDSVSGSIYYNLHEGKSEAELLSKLNYDAVTLGNHDFDRSSQGISNFLAHLSIPAISSNIDFTHDPLVPNLPPYLIKGGIGIFALTTLETLDKADPRPETVFKNPLETAKEMVETLDALGVKCKILLSHLGKSMDERLALAIPGIDVIMGGHTHDVLYEPVNLGETLILQAGCHGKFVGELHLNLQTRAFQSKIHPINESVPEHPDFKPLIDTLKQERDTYASKIVAATMTRLNGDRHQQKSGETNLGDLVVDAYFAKAQKLGFAPDAAILNGLGVRTSLEVGPITVGDLIKVLPYSKYLLVLACSGAQLKRALENGLYPQISQLQVKSK